MILLLPKFDNLFFEDSVRYLVLPVGSVGFALLTHLSCPFVTFVEGWGMGLLAQGLPLGPAHKVRMSPSEDPLGEKGFGYTEKLDADSRTLRLLLDLRAGA